MRWVMQDLAGVARQPEHDHRTHLRAALEWIGRAQDASCGVPGSVSAGWSFECGWLAASDEATGLLVETCSAAANYLVWPELEVRARRMAGALLAQEDTASPARLHGLLAPPDGADRAERLTRAQTCGRALCEAPSASLVADAEAAHALARLANVTGDARWIDATRARLSALCARQTPCGWFFDGTGPASLFALAGVIRGMAEAAAALGDESALRAAMQAARALYERLDHDGRLAGAYDDGWMPAAEHACLPGLARVAACWLRLAQLGEGAHWREGAWRALSWIKRNQRTVGEDPALRDALPNTAPIWRGEAAFRFDVLGAKYFADALMMDMVGIAIPPSAQKAESA
jgi:hypothetical protein